jgi:predicted ribonuclease YlaK
MGDLVEQLAAKADEVFHHYHRLVLFTGPAGSGKTATLQALCAKLGVTRLNLNLELSRRLLDMPAQHRAIHLSSVLEEIIAEAGGAVVVLDNIELLFDPALQQDPLRLLQNLSRNRTIVAAWNGLCQDGRLVYGESGHIEYRSYPDRDLCVVCASQPDA